MILTPALAETAAILANIPEDTLQLYPPLERCVIIAAKEMMKQKNPRLLPKKTKNAIIKITKLRNGGQVKS